MELDSTNLWIISVEADENERKSEFDYWTNLDGSFLKGGFLKAIYIGKVGDFPTKYYFLSSAEDVGNVCSNVGGSLFRPSFKVRRYEYRKIPANLQENVEKWIKNYEKHY